MSLKYCWLPNKPGQAKLNWPYKSKVLFSMGVPVNTILFFDCNNRQALYRCESGFFMACDSSKKDITKMEGLHKMNVRQQHAITRQHQIVFFKCVIVLYPVGTMNGQHF
jgi:hypothetical protein